MNENQNDMLCCPKCVGKGKVELSSYSPILAETLALLRKVGPLTATQVSQRLKKKNIGVTGMNNRLEELRGHGLITRTKYGREWLYEAKEVE